MYPAEQIFEWKENLLRILIIDDDLAPKYVKLFPLRRHNFWRRMRWDDYICCIFKDAVNNSNYIASNDRLINE
jgi:hypothetical protein